MVFCASLHWQKGHHILLDIQSKIWHQRRTRLLQGSPSLPRLRAKVWDRFYLCICLGCTMGNHQNLNGHSHTPKLEYPLIGCTDSFSQRHPWQRCIHVSNSRFFKTRRRPPCLQNPQISLWLTSKLPSMARLFPHCPSSLEPHIISIRSQSLFFSHWY